MILPTFTGDRRQPGSGEIDPSAASNEIGMMRCCERSKVGARSLGSATVHGVVFAFLIVVLDLFLSRAILFA
jgi:hypothetical protein